MLSALVAKRAANNKAADQDKMSICSDIVIATSVLSPPLFYSLFSQTGATLGPGIITNFPPRLGLSMSSPPLFTPLPLSIGRDSALEFLIRI